MFRRGAVSEQKEVTMVFPLLAMLGCEFEGGEWGEGGEEGGEEGGGGGGGGGGVDASGCNTANESCGPGRCGGEGANMLPGADCLQCHNSGGGEASKWTVGGTVFTDDQGTDGVSGAKVRITDASGATVEISTSSSGNFYTSRSLKAPLSAEIVTASGTVSMGRTVSTGACNNCHSCGGEAGGKLFAP